MGAKDLASVLFGPGELVLSPTDLSTAFPHGGTRLGYSEDGITIRPKFVVRPLVGEPSHTPYAHLFLGSALEARIVLRQWDDDTIQRAFPGGLTAAATDGRTVQFPGTLSPGTALTGSRLLWSPEDLGRGRVVLFRSAITILEEGSEIKGSRQKGAALTLSIFALADTTIAASDARYASRVAAWGLRENISIT